MKDIKIGEKYRKRESERVSDRRYKEVTSNHVHRNILSYMLGRE